MATVGRPTSYTPELLEKAREYLNTLPADEIIHTIEGLSLYIGITRKTIYEWISQEDKREFCDIYEQIMEKQGKELVNKGLSGKYAPVITKVMMTKHGYRDSQELTGKDGEKLTIEVIKYDKPE